jgi:large subunit ribosomal protein L18
MKIDKRRKVEGKTDYRQRLTLLKGQSPRFVVRKTNRYLILQIVESNDAQDSVKFGITTKDLIQHGWPEDKSGSLKSLTASYLGGYLIGKKMNHKERVILDMGLLRNTKGSRVYAAVKGLADAGIKIKYSEDVVPSEEMIEGEHKEILSKVKKNIDNGK